MSGRNSMYQTYSAKDVTDYSMLKLHFIKGEPKGEPKRFKLYKIIGKINADICVIMYNKIRYL